MNILIFEDEKVKQFYPISETRPVWELRSGIYKNYERIILKCNKNKEINNYYFFCREELVELYREKYPEFKINVDIPQNDDLIMLNGSIVDFPLFENLKKNTIYMLKNSVLAVYVDKDNCSNILKHFDAFVNENLNIINIDENDYAWSNYRYIWNLVLNNGGRIKKDYKYLDQTKNLFDKYNVTYIGDKSQIYIEDNCKIDPFVVFDASKGPIVIKENVEINPFSRIEGPCFIGNDVVLLGANVREGCSIGEVCRVGGEVEDSIFQGYSNKYHDGFIGHAYIGEWVNLGALSTNSDLKNNYSTVSVYLPGGIKDTGETKVGSFIGDFTKTSIGSLMNTGASLGVGSMVVHSGRMTPPYLPDFSWFIKNKLREVKCFDEFIQSSKTMMSRRGVKFSVFMERLLKELFNKSKKIRKEIIKEWNDQLK